MKKLKLPIIKNAPNQKKSLSMDEYFKFVMFNLKHTDKKAGKIEKPDFTVPFKI